ncbi:uncharacterized protein LOC121178668 [Toxotes jaculatrix]|uniref:uncharacterized protein LOC121178668 n=1 Tax=Toxotes jaculatrix TaxID=941984 RepID=UPI001B3AA130|nr:uncharacterized protein LOC121178668 [Toxotes jaculatrix]
MIKTLCVAVVVLSLTSVCQPASLACETLLKPIDKGPDLSGIWYFIAMSSNTCLPPVLLSTVIWPSVAVDITSTATPNIYDANFKMKMYGVCNNSTFPIFYGNNTVSEVGSYNAQKPKLAMLLQSGCPDCLIVKDDSFVSHLVLFSRRQIVTAAELKEFETQADCLGWYKPQLLNTDHDYENCTAQTGDDIDIDTHASAAKILKNMFSAPFRCLSEKVLYYPRSAFAWAQQTWNSLW